MGEAVRQEYQLALRPAGRRTVGPMVMAEHPHVFLRKPPVCPNPLADVRMSDPITLLRLPERKALRTGLNRDGLEVVIEVGGQDQSSHVMEDPQEIRFAFLNSGTLLHQSPGDRPGQESVLPERVLFFTAQMLSLVEPVHSITC